MGIGFLFKLGKWIGFMVGVIICYQIINADLSDHMAEFATLKAIGHRNGYFVRIVMQEALLLSRVELHPRTVGSVLLYDQLARYTGLSDDARFLADRLDFSVDDCHVRRLRRLGDAETVRRRPGRVVLRRRRMQCRQRYEGSA